MKGKYHIVVQNNRLRYELNVKRNITIIRGDSATGKTTLINMLESASALGESSGVEVICEKKCRTLSGSDWEIILPNIQGQIIFLDEENLFIKSKKFASAVKKSDNYFVIVTREDLPNLPYSVDEIYGIHSSGRYHDTRRVYNEMYRIYSVGELCENLKPDMIVVEDSNSGYEFFEAVCKEKGTDCKSAGGKSNLKSYLQNISGENILAIADGAAIGPEMNELYQLMKCKPGIKCYLPESFEWLILKSEILDSKSVREILAFPENYIDSREYFSWEQYFTALLVECTKDSYLRYNKSKLNEAYFSEKTKRAVLEVIKGIEW